MPSPWQDGYERVSTLGLQLYCGQVANQKFELSAPLTRE